MKKQSKSQQFWLWSSLWASRFLVTVLLLGQCLFSTAFATDKSEQTTFSFQLENVSIQEVLDQIEHQSEYRFIFQREKVDVDKKVSVSVEKNEIAEVLESTFSNVPITYKITSKNLILLKKKAVASTSRSENQSEIEVSGTVTDSDRNPLPGVAVIVAGSSRGVITDFDGKYKFTVDPMASLEFSFLGMATQKVAVNGKSVVNVTLQSDTEQLEDVTVVAFGKQKKESVLASIETVDTKELKVPSSNLTTALAGRMAGIISYQRSGEPGQDNAEFFVRGVTTFGYKKDPLILIDNIESTSDDLSGLQTDDIASFSIMKDATATALYGARGANGVILITTKGGVVGKAKISVRFENSFSTPTKNIDLADPITYMKMHNESYRTRNAQVPVPYSQEKIEYTQQNINPYVYPQTDWYDDLFKDQSINQRLNFNVSGGGKVARYYLAASVTQDNGVLKNDGKNNFNSNIDLTKISVRSNIDIDVTKTTEIGIKVNGNFADYQGPLSGGSGLYNMVMQANPVRFPAFYAPDEANEFTNHILYGNADEGTYINPYAEMTKGYKDYSDMKVTLQIELKQDLSWIIDGLSARVLGSTSRSSYFDVQRYYNPYFYNVGTYDRISDTYTLDAINEETGTEYLGYSEGDKKVASSMYMEAAAQYDKTIADKHGISGMLIFIAREELIGNAGDLQASLPYHNLGLSGRFTYSYDSRYFLEANFGYNGSERFDTSHRWGFFPSAGAGWILSNENFWRSKAIDKLKLKGTYGLVGNDAIGSEDDRFFYLSNVNMNNGNYGATFGKNFSEYHSGVSISRYANSDITWETATKMNLGFEIGLFDGLEIQADYFTESRTNILMSRVDVSSMGFQASMKANVGEAKSSGIDASLDLNKNINNNLWVSGRANFTYAASEFVYYEEPDYSATPWLSKEGKGIKQSWGYVAERLFIDQADVDNSPTQFGQVLGGDIKYKDVNDDGLINSYDKVPIGYPTTPEIVYGFGFSAGYKNFDLSCFFQGSARSSFWINPTKTAPFIDVNDDFTGENALLEAYANDYWSEDNRNAYALWPRLDFEANTNNSKTSTWFMQDGSFLRLKSLEFGYSLPRKMIKTAGFSRFRIYYSGSNLHMWSGFDLWDTEMGGNGLGYPIQKVHNLGLQIAF